MPAHDALAVQSLEFARACISHWSLPKQLSKIVIECEIGQPLRLYVVCPAAEMLNRSEPASAIVDAFASVTVTDRAEVIPEPHISRDE